ncbi:MAG: alpha/beta fold hydrolase [Pseudomonadota bacterium]
MKYFLILLLCLIHVGTAYADAPSSVHFSKGEQDGESFNAALMAYKNADLRLYALIATPKTTPPKDGFPIVIAGHGYVPDPRRYGITKTGKNARPGDYYRSVPELYTSRGYMVIMPDYRGHNGSDGPDAPGYPTPQLLDAYANDVLALLPVVKQIPSANTAQLYYWGHSMGGAVGLRLLQKTQAFVAATFWSTTQAVQASKELVTVTTPLALHHGVGDTSTPPAHSVEIVTALAQHDQYATYYTYKTADHFFNADMRALAADRDVAFFRQVSR